MSSLLPSALIHTLLPPLPLSTHQMSFAYSEMVRSVENLPVPAVDMMDMRVHFLTSL